AGEPDDTNAADEAQAGEPDGANAADEAQAGEPDDANAADKAGAGEPDDANAADEAGTGEPDGSTAGGEVVVEPAGANGGASVGLDGALVSLLPSLRTNTLWMKIAPSPPVATGFAGMADAGVAEELFYTSHILDGIRCRPDFIPWMADTAENIHQEPHGMLGTEQDKSGLVEYARACIVATGDRICWAPYKADYNRGTFRKCSTDAIFCLQKLTAVTPRPDVPPGLEECMDIAGLHWQILLAAAQFAFERAYNTPFANPSNKGDDQPMCYQQDHFQLHRPNHSLAHALRQTWYAPFMLQHLRCSPLMDQAKWGAIGPRELLSAQLRLILEATGRQEDYNWSSVYTQSSLALRMEFVQLVLPPVGEPDDAIAADKAEAGEPDDTNAAAEAEAGEPDSANAADEAEAGEPDDANAADEAEAGKPDDTNAAAGAGEPDSANAADKAEAGEPDDANAADKAEAGEPDDTNAAAEAEADAGEPDDTNAAAGAGEPDSANAADKAEAGEPDDAKAADKAEVRTFSTSRYKKHYLGCKALTTTKKGPLKTALEALEMVVEPFLMCYLTWLQLPVDMAKMRVEGFSNDLQKDLVAACGIQPANLVQELSSLDVVFQRLWTSGKKMNVAPDGEPECEKELCSLLNDAIRSDAAEVIEAAAQLARNINKPLVSIPRQTGVPNMLPKMLQDCSWDHPGIGRCHPCWRGGGFGRDPKLREFFQEGVGYRAPMFVATSFNMDKALEFMSRCSEDTDAILWTVHVPNGCRNVSYLPQSNFQDKNGKPTEDEYLFVPYSAFKVLRVAWSPTPSIEPHKLHVQAIEDNVCSSEDLPLCPWC
ncbi:hypothetical protein CYMTET_2886, partial [Cymbomonas tetramitiformis]